MLVSAIKQFWARSYIQTLVESGAAIFAMIKPLVVFKPLLGAGAFYLTMLSIDMVVTGLLLCVSIPLAILQYRNLELRKKLKKHRSENE